MAIDSLNSLSTEQLLALTMNGNSQLTGSDLSSSSINESDIAFQTVMDNLINSSKSSNVSSANNISTEQLMAMSLMSNGQLTNNDSNNSLSNDMSNQMVLSNALMMKSIQESAKNSNDTKNTNVQQDCPTGQDLEKLSMIVNGKVVDYDDYNSVNNATKADMEKIYAAVDEASKKYGVNKDLILAVIKQESNFDSTAVSGAGAKGLMQIMPFNFNSVGIKSAYDVNQNINGGTQILKQNLDQYNGNIEMALMAYNAGSGTMQKRGVTSAKDLYKMPTETQNYVPSVLKYYKNGV